MALHNHSMDEAIQQMPDGVENDLTNFDFDLNEVVGEFFGMVGGARLEESVSIDLDPETGNIYARHEDFDKVACLSFDEEEVTASEVTPEDFSEIRRDLVVVSRPATPNVRHD